MNPFYCIDCAETHESVPILVGPYQICEPGFRDRIVPQERSRASSQDRQCPLGHQQLHGLLLSRISVRMEDKATRVYHISPTASVLSLRGVSREEETARRRARLPSLSELSSDHVCDLWQGNIRTEAPLYDLEKIEDAFTNLKRRDDYQLCPNETCKIKVTLADGCNHMTCPFCRTDFCFICGNRAKDRSAHWSIGNPCPRFGKKGSPRAIYDPQQQFVPNYFRINAGNRRQMTLNTYRNINAIGRDPAGAGQVEAEEQQIMTTPRGRLYSEDFDILQEIHDRIIWQETYDYPYGPTVEELRVAHSLVHRLEREMEIYITDMRVNGAPTTPFRDNVIHRTANERIRSHVNQLGDVVDQYAGFRNIILSYTEAWEGQTDQIWAIRQG